MIVLIHVIRVFYIHYQSQGVCFEECKAKVNTHEKVSPDLQIFHSRQEGKSLLGAREFYFQILVDFIWISPNALHSGVLFSVGKIKSNFTRNVIKFFYSYTAVERASRFLRCQPERETEKYHLNKCAMKILCRCFVNSWEIVHEMFPLRLQWKFSANNEREGFDKIKMCSKFTLPELWRQCSAMRHCYYSISPCRVAILSPILQPNTVPIALIRPAKLHMKFAFIVQQFKHFSRCLNK